MQGAIRNIDSLEKWFTAVGKPFFTLSYAGQATQVILRNTAIEEMSESWQMLKEQVLAQAEYGRATMHLIVYGKEKGANNPDGRTNIDILPTASHLPAGPAGIGSLPAGYLDESKVQGMISDAQERWEMRREIEDLKAQVNSPNNMLEKAIHLMGEYPHLAGMAQMVLGKFLNMPQMPLPNPQIAGTPAPADENIDDTFEEDIEALTKITGVPDTALAKAMRQWAEQNPEAARQMFQAK